MSGTYPFGTGNAALHRTEGSAKADGDGSEATLSVLVGSGDLSFELFRKWNTGWETKFFHICSMSLSFRLRTRIDQREVAALGTRLAALDMVFRLKGYYAPKQTDPDANSNVSVLIDMSAIPPKDP